MDKLNKLTGFPTTAEAVRMVTESYIGGEVGLHLEQQIKLRDRTAFVNANEQNLRMAHVLGMLVWPATPTGRVVRKSLSLELQRWLRTRNRNDYATPVPMELLAEICVWSPTSRMERPAHIIQTLLYALEFITNTPAPPEPASNPKPKKIRPTKVSTRR